jgi:hypothetical protein
MFTPDKFAESQVGNYMKFEDGQNRIRILEKPITGYVYWEDAEGNLVPKNEMAGKGGKPVRVKSWEGLTNAQRGAMKGFAAMVVWNYQAERIQILEVKQVGIMNALEALSLSKSWGDVTSFDIVITKTRTGINPTDVEYSVMPEPKEPVSKEIKEAYKEAHIDLEALYRGEDPFGVEKTEPEGLEEVDLDDLNLEDLDAQVAKK